jgi:hypothetical protein
MHTGILGPRDRSRLGATRFDVGEKDPARVDRFYEAMEPHLAEIARLHNLKLARKRGSARHLVLQDHMRDVVRMVVGDAPFDRFEPSWWREEEWLSEFDEDSIERRATWACYRVVDAIDLLAQELYRDASLLLGNYHNALFAWWRQVESHGIDAVNAVIGAEPQFLN